MLPPTDRKLTENEQFPPSYFIALHNDVVQYGVHNYRGARIPLPHNNINVERFREYLTGFNYPHIHIMQFIEFGFPLGLWSDSFLVPNNKNHSSSYSYFSYVDKFVESELDKICLTGPLTSAPWDDIMISSMMTANK